MLQDGGTMELLTEFTLPDTYREFVEMFPDDAVCVNVSSICAGLKDLSVRLANLSLLYARKL